jgi:hypothetical protein
MKRVTFIIIRGTEKSKVTGGYHFKASRLVKLIFFTSNVLKVRKEHCQTGKRIDIA